MGSVQAHGLDVGVAQLVTGNTEMAQAEIFGDSEVFAIAGSV